MSSDGSKMGSLNMSRKTGLRRVVVASGQVTLQRRARTWWMLSPSSHEMERVDSDASAVGRPEYDVGVFVGNGRHQCGRQATAGRVRGRHDVGASIRVVVRG